MFEKTMNPYKRLLLQKLTVIFTIFASSINVFAADKISSSISISSPTTAQEISSARVGEQVKILISLSEAHLLANENVALSYSLSVLPTGSKTPVTISGKLAGIFRFPNDQGGAVRTSEETADWAGTKTAEGLITIPEFMPEGKATLTVSVARRGGGIRKGIGAIALQKTLEIKL
jgi:hypothetical protein